MSATKAQRLAERDAFELGAKLVMSKCKMKITHYAEEIIRGEAKAMFPIPMVKRPRTAIVALPSRSYEFKVENGVQLRRMVWNNGLPYCTDWSPSNWTHRDLERLVSLFVQPTEEVEVQ